MPTIDLDTVHHIAGLSKLHFSEEEAKTMVHELESILEHIAVLEGLPASSAPPPPTEPTPLRDDEVTTRRQAQTMLRTAPNQKDGYLKVPSVLGNSTDGQE